MDDEVVNRRGLFWDLWLMSTAIWQIFAKIDTAIVEVITCEFV